MLKDKLLKKLQKKGAKDMDPIEKKAKMDVVHEMGRQASELLGKQIHPLKKVSVASNTKEGLKEGLDKAAGLIDHGDLDHETDPDKIVEGAEEEEHADLDKDAEDGESLAHLAAVKGKAKNAHDYVDSSGEDEIDPQLAEEHADHTPEELDHKIAMLSALKQKKQRGHA